MIVAIVLALVPLGARADTIEASITGPTQYTPGAPTPGFRGRFTVTFPRTTGLPMQPVDVMLDGFVAMTILTNSEGRFVFTLPAIPGEGVHRVQAIAHHGLPTEARSPTLTILSVARLSLDPAAADFGTVVLGTAPVDRAFTITNHGFGTSGPVTVAASPGEFVATSCPAAPSGIPGGTSCSVNVRFTPVTVGSKSGTLTASATPGGSMSASLTAVATGLVATPSAVPFPTVTVGMYEEATVTVRNTSSSPSGILTGSITGPNASEFSIRNDGCSGIALGAGATCTYVLRFAPTSEGNGKLATAIFSASPGGTARTSGSGAGLVAILRITPSDTNFGTWPPLLTPSRTFFAENRGPLSAGVVTLTLTGDDAFRVIEDNCSGTVLDPFEQCTFEVEFGSTQEGDYVAFANLRGTVGGNVTASMQGAVRII